MQENICKILRDARLEQGISATKMAKDLGIDRRTIYNMEKIHQCTLTTICMIAEYLGYSIGFYDKRGMICLC